MDTVCAVVGCKSKWTPGTDLEFFRVTSNKNVLPLWLQVVKLNLAHNAMICSLHFKEEDIVDKGGEKRLKFKVVPSYNLVRRNVEEKVDESGDDDNVKLSTMRTTLLKSKQNDVNMKIRMAAPQATSTCMVDTPTNLPLICENVEYSEKTKSVGTQARLRTEEETTLKRRIKVLNQKIKRREEKVTYLQTVLKMIKKNVKGTDMAYKLCCELENISDNPNIDESFNEIEKELKNHNSDDEEFAGYDKGTFVEVALSPNLTRNSNVL